MAYRRCFMVPEHHLPEVVLRARRRASLAGELRLSRPHPHRTLVPPEVADAIVALLRDGTYAAAVERVALADPGLRDG
ncbi:MAG TPA: hypothetical protein VLL25_00200 [Acidimicrobiales bacterium]|nr:hypothetical protein [Acidimicrobiales bacterium]